MRIFFSETFKKDGLEPRVFRFAFGDGFKHPVSEFFEVIMVSLTDVLKFCRGICDIKGIKEYKITITIKF